MFDIRIVNLDSGYYLCMTTKKTLAKVETDKKYLHLQAFLDSRRYFTPIFYSVDGIPGVDDLAAQSRLSALLIFNMKQ